MEINLLSFFDTKYVNKEKNEKWPTEEQLKACFKFYDE